MKRYCFNMIEIILAISILAIGISSVMVLFTSGLKANNSAISTSALPDVVESSISRIRALAMYSATYDSWGTFVTGMPASYANEGSFDTSGNPDEFLIQGTADAANQNNQYNFLYRQLSRDDNGNNVSTFSAIVRVKRRANNVPLVNPVNGNGISYSQELTDLLNNVFAELELEISYPADVPFSAREVKNYRMELYNDKYNRICLP